MKEINDQAFDVDAIVVLIHYHHYTAVSKVVHILVFHSKLKFCIVTLVLIWASDALRTFRISPVSG
jgi:hypothetical protein